jgi:S-adenosylmethionine hydrolase
VSEGELIVYVNSTNGLTLAVNRGSAGERLAISSGDRIALTSA